MACLFPLKNGNAEAIPAEVNSDVFEDPSPLLCVAAVTIKDGRGGSGRQAREHKKRKDKNRINEKNRLWLPAS